MAAHEPSFDPSLKKRKKKTVAFTEDLLGADADPTTPAPMGGADDEPGTTVHEQQSALRDGREGEEAQDNAAATAVDGADDLSAMFGGLKKKKKKKEIPMDLGEEGSGTSTPAEVTKAFDELDLSDLKKKKKKKDIPLNLDDGSGTSTPVTKEVEEGAVGEDLDFSDLKKLKKKKKKAAFDLEAFERELGEGGESEEGGTKGSVDASRDEDTGDVVFDGEGAGRRGAESDPWVGSDRNYTYPELLRRFYSQLHAANPSLLSSGKRYTIPPPQIHRESNKKSIFVNLEDICKRLHRQPEHVIQFMFAEMGTNGSVDGERRLVLKGRFQQKQIENVLRRYIVEYVTCKTCKSPDTLLDKENRIFFVQCQSCGSRWSVNAIKMGFQAQATKRKH